MPLKSEVCVENVLIILVLSLTSLTAVVQLFFLVFQQVTNFRGTIFCCSHVFVFVDLLIYFALLHQGCPHQLSNNCSLKGVLVVFNQKGNVAFKDLCLKLTFR